MKIVAVMPMKLNNRRLPHKNTRNFTGGNPLFSYALNSLSSIDKIDEIYMYCSDYSIKEMLPENIKYLLRSEELDQDTTTINEVLLSFAKEINADIYILVHATAPFISRESIEKGIKAVVSGEYDSSFSVVRKQDFMWKDGCPLNYQLEHVPRTQDLPIIYEETSGFYIFNKKVLIESNRRIGDNPFLVEVGKVEAIDIDEEEDFMIADAVNYYNEKVRLGGVLLLKIEICKNIQLHMHYREAA